jgi:hypothetical protein
VPGSLLRFSGAEPFTHRKEIIESAKLAGAYSDEVQYLVRTLLHVRSEIAQLEQQLAVDLGSTRTPRFTSVFPDLQTSSAPGSWESRETTRRVTPLLDRARTTSATRRSPKLGGAPDRCHGESPAIACWLTRPSDGQHAPSTPRPVLAATTSSSRPATSLTPWLSEHSPNKLTGILHERRLYDEANAWPVQLHEEAA